MPAPLGYQARDAAVARGWCSIELAEVKALVFDGRLIIKSRPNAILLQKHIEHVGIKVIDAINQPPVRYRDHLMALQVNEEPDQSHKRSGSHEVNHNRFPLGHRQKTAWRKSR